MRALFAALEGVSSVTQLVLYPYDQNDPEGRYNAETFGLEALLALARVLRSPACRISTLVLNWCLRNDDDSVTDGVAELAAALRSCAALREVHLAENEHFCPDFDSIEAACTERAPPVRVVMSWPNWEETGRPVREDSWW